MNIPDFNNIIPLITYPNRDVIKGIEKINQTCDEQITTNLAEFLDQIKDKSLEKLQEEFTHTFDLNPATCLDIGWHLYGENYERGAFMVRMRELLREFNIIESSELPDHLSHILAVLTKMDTTNRQAFIKKYVAPALDKILAGFSEDSNSYKYLIQFIHDFLNNQLKYQEGNS